MKTIVNVLLVSMFLLFGSCSKYLKETLVEKLGDPYTVKYVYKGQVIDSMSSQNFLITFRYDTTYFESFTDFGRVIGFSTSSKSVDVNPDSCLITHYVFLKKSETDSAAYYIYTGALTIEDSLFSISSKQIKQ